MENKGLRMSTDKEKEKEPVVKNIGKGPFENSTGGPITPEEFESVIKWMKDNDISESVSIESVIDFLRYPVPGKVLKIR